MAASLSITIGATDNASKLIESVNKRIAAVRAPAERLSKQLSDFSRLSGIGTVAKSFQTMERNAVAAFRSVSRVVSPLAAISSAASVAGMYRLTELWAKFAQQLGNAATRIGLSVPALSALQGAAELAGVSAEGLTSGLQALGQNMYDAIGGRSPETVALMNQLGIAFDDGTQHIRNLTQVLPEVADRIAGMKDPYNQARVASQLFGGAAEELLPFLRLGSKGIAEYAAQAQRYTSMTASAVAAANRLRRAQASVSLAVQGLTNSIAERLAPIITPLLQQMADWIAANRNWIASGIGDAVQNLIGFVQQLDFKSITKDVEDFARKADSAAQYFGGWKNVLEGIIAINLAGWAGRALAPITSLLRLLSVIPGSGITGAGLAIAGVEIAAIKGADALVGDTPKNDSVRNEHGSLGRWIYDHSSALRLADNWLQNSARNAPDVLSLNSLAAPEAQRASMAYFRAQGWTAAQAAGPTANIMAESGFNPFASGDHGSAYGLGQWHADRQAAYTKKFGHTMQSVMDRAQAMQEQLAFYDFELKGGGDKGAAIAGRLLRGSSDAGHSGAVVSIFDERPSAEMNAANSRSALANSLYAAEQSAGARGLAGANGQVDVKVQVSGGGVDRVTAKGTGNVTAPKVMTTGVGYGNGPT